MPFIISNTKITSVLSSLVYGRDYIQVSRFNPNTQAFEHFVNDPRFNDFDSFTYCTGYQIYISNPSGCSLTLRGRLAPYTYNLSPGKNLIAIPLNSEKPVPAVLASLTKGIDYSDVLHYNKQAGRFESYSQGQFSIFKPNEAYYVVALKECSFSILPGNPTQTNFLYDGDGGRVKKTVGSNSTTYIGSLYEKDSDGKTTKHIFAGVNRIASVIASPAGTKQSLFQNRKIGTVSVFCGK